MSDRIENASGEAAAERLVSAASELFSEVLQRHGLPEDGGDGVELVWRPGMRPEELLENAEIAVAELASAYADFQKGHVYCYSCQTSSCEHSTPPDPEHVFAGYESTGTAQWIELYSLLLNLDDPRTELLFRRPPRIVSRYVGRRNLIDQQLVSFGKNSLTYRIWGQVVAGYLWLEDSKCAMSIQLVETRDHRLHLQVIAPAALMDALAESVERNYSPLRRIHDAIADARRQIESLGSTWRQSRSRQAKNKARSRATGLMRHLSHSIEKKGRQERRRTEHAEERGGQRRPIHKAGDDLAVAQSGDFYRDVVKDACIVVGKAGRIHVFSRQGRHVTSLNLKGDELARRVQRRRYQAMSAEEIQALRRAVADGE